MENKNEPLSLTALIPIIRELTAKGEEFELKPHGRSMLPTIKEGRDTVLFCRAEPPYTRGDLLLFCRDDGTPVLHRLVDFTREGKLVMRGDAQFFIETIDESQVVAAVKRYFRGKREIRTDAPATRRRTRWLLATYPIRVRWFSLKNKVKRVFKR